LVVNRDEQIQVHALFDVEEFIRDSPASASDFDVFGSRVACTSEYTGVPLLGGLEAVLIAREWNLSIGARTLIEKAYTSELPGSGKHDYDNY
jgi:hypothetical protein